jgi:hypothetical protein
MIINVFLFYGISTLLIGYLMWCAPLIDDNGKIMVQEKKFKDLLKKNMMGILISILISGIVTYFWVKGLDNMNKNHSDYKGEDFLN